MYSLGWGEDFLPVPFCHGDADSNKRTIQTINTADQRKYHDLYLLNVRKDTIIDSYSSIPQVEDVILPLKNKNLEKVKHLLSNTFSETFLDHHPTEFLLQLKYCIIFVYSYCTNSLWVPQESYVILCIERIRWQIWVSAKQSTWHIYNNMNIPITYCYLILGPQTLLALFNLWSYKSELQLLFKK